MMKKIISLLLAVALLAARIDVPVFGAENTEVHIQNEDEFYLLTEQCRTEAFSTGKVFYLETDLELSEYENLCLPVMDGLFDGQGHTISGVTLNEEISDYGLFRYVGGNGTIRNLTVEAEVTGSEDQENIGILAGSNGGTILNCISRGILNGETGCGGIVGKNEKTGTILRSSNQARIDGTYQTGGIAGANEGTITDCTNMGQINTSQKRLKEMNGDGSVNISIPNAVAGLTSDERANETGGIAGSSEGSISYCRNEGTVGCEHLGYATGGIVGQQSGSVTRCTNVGTVYGRKNVGGIIGYFDPYEATAYDRDIGQELRDQLDELSDLMGSLSDAGEQLGDHVSDNLDVLSDQLTGLKNSLRGHLDNLGDISEDGQDDIHDQMEEVQKTLDSVSFEVNIESAREHMAAIQQDMTAIQAILEALAPLLEEAGEELQQAIGQYEEQMSQLQQVLEQLQAFLESQAGAGGGTGGSGEGEGGTGTGGSGEGEGGEEAGAGDPGEEGPGETSAVQGQYVFVALTDEEEAQIQAAMEQLERLNQDIQVHLQGLLSALGGMSEEAEKLSANIRKLAGGMEEAADMLEDALDDLSNEVDDMRTDLRNRGDNISNQVDATSDTLESDWDVVSDRLNQIKDQFHSIRATISDGFDELESRIEERSVYVDISELAASEDGNGKVLYCSNTGEIIADSQVGGIIGGITKEGTADVSSWIFGREDDDKDDEDEKDSVTKHVLAAVFNCKNTGGISAEKDYVGGIVGLASYGAFFSCENYGDVWSEDGKYVGGIAGLAEHAVRDSYVLCGLKGTSCVGGVSGDGEDISGSYVCVYMDMEDMTSSTGAIVGRSDGTVENNYFVDNGYGAVDGVTRDQEAVGMDYETLLELTDLPENFRTFTIRFVDGDDVVWQDTFSYGDEFSEENYPELTEPEGKYAFWEDKKVSPVCRNVTLHAVYRAYVPSLASGENERHPAVLLGGEFYPDSVLAVREASEEEISFVKENLNEKSGCYVKQVYYYEISQEEALRPQMSVRIQDDHYRANSLAVLDEEGQLQGEIQKTEKIGDYLSADMTMAEKGYVVVVMQTNPWSNVLGVGGILVLVALGGFLLLRKKKKL